MCGRFTNRYTLSELVRLCRLTGSPPESNFPPRYNIAPTQKSFVVRQRERQRELAELRWGLVPLGEGLGHPGGESELTLTRHHRL